MTSIYEDMEHFFHKKKNTGTHDILPILFYINHMLSSKLQTGLDMYWLKQGDISGTAGFVSLSA